MGPGFRAGDGGEGGLPSKSAWKDRSSFLSSNGCVVARMADSRLPLGRMRWLSLGEAQSVSPAPTFRLGLHTCSQLGLPPADPHFPRGAPQSVGPEGSGGS